MISIDKRKELLVYLVQEILDQLYEVSSLQKSYKSAGLSKLLLREMCSVLPELEPELQQFYFTILPTLTASRSLKRPEISLEYAKQSRPSKEKFIETMRTQLAA